MLTGILLIHLLRIAAVVVPAAALLVLFAVGTDEAIGVIIGGVVIAEAGHPRPDYREAQVMPHMKGREIDIAVDVGVGRGKAMAWTCDLTHGYIAINADYRS